MFLKSQIQTKKSMSKKGDYEGIVKHSDRESEQEKTDVQKEYDGITHTGKTGDKKETSSNSMLEHAFGKSESSMAAKRHFKGIPIPGREKRVLAKESEEKAMPIRKTKKKKEERVCGLKGTTRHAEKDQSPAIENHHRGRGEPKGGHQKFNRQKLGRKKI